MELLASVIWHLELAASLAPWPRQKMQRFYLELLCDQPDALTPWKIWVDHYNEVRVKRSQAQLLIDFSLRERADVAVYAVQNTLIADAAMRLDSARELLRTMSKQNSLVLLKRPALESRVTSRRVPRKVKDTAIVVAFRDSYLHAEVTTENKHLAKFRQTLGDRYSLFDVGMTCLRVWKELYKLCMRSIRASQTGAP